MAILLNGRHSGQHLQLAGKPVGGGEGTEHCREQGGQVVVEDSHNHTEDNAQEGKWRSTR